MRETQRIITAHHQEEGGGFIVRRPLPTAGLDHLDPFLLIDELGPIDYAPGEAIGAPDHPHRGFETVSYILAGELEHEDSAGHRGTLGPGDVQWMTAGAGIVHSEMPSRHLQERGGRVHGFQIWVNLPASLKMTRPRYQDVPSARIPVAELPHARVKRISAAIETHRPIVFEDWTLEAGADVRVELPPSLRAMVYVFGGSAEVGGKTVHDGQLALLGDGDAVRLRASGAARLLVLAGEPIREPVVRYGPFVMSSERELLEAFADYRSGKLGEITRSARHT